MTREEAIRRLKEYLTDYLPDYYDEEKEAFDMAIKALEQEQEPKISLEVYKQVTKERDIAIEQLHELGYEFGEKIEPTTNNDLGVDCISRKAVVDAFGKWCSDDKNLEHPVWFARDIISMPSITPLEPKKGHWVIRPHVYGVTYCSECDFELKIDNTNFCPNCGAKMVEPQESEG